MNSTALASPASSSTLGLSPSELEQFQRQGWVIKRNLLDAASLHAMATQVDGLHERMAAQAPKNVHISWEESLPADAAPRIRQLMNSQVVVPSIDALSRSESVLAVMRQLIGPDVYLFHSKLMMKAARDGSFTPWHQDFQYWQYEARRPTQINCMLFIDAADAANGCLRMVDGTQQHGLQPIVRLPSDSFNIGIDGDLAAYPQASLLTMAPGDAVFFGPLVIHGSGPNLSDRDRRANTFAYDAPSNRLKGELPAANWRCGRAPTAPAQPG